MYSLAERKWKKLGKMLDSKEGIGTENDILLLYFPELRTFKNIHLKKFLNKV